VQCQRCFIQTCITHISTNHEHLCEACIVGDITKNFSRHEFTCHCGCGFDSIDERIVHRLQVVRDILQVPITINSGCRCLKHNYSVGGKPASFHLEGKAIDWTVEDEATLMEADRLLTNWSGGFRHYLDFIHCDIGPKRRW
jgi:hypothetical protein